MNPSDVARLREAIVQFFKTHTHSTISMSCLKNYYSPLSYEYRESVYFVTRFGDLILEREDFILGIDETGTE